MARPVGSGKVRRKRGAEPPSAPLADLRDQVGVDLHELKNLLASVRLRVGVVAADPTCQWAQQENLAAVLRILDQAMAMARALDERHRQTAAEGKPSSRRIKRGG